MGNKWTLTETAIAWQVAHGEITRQAAADMIGRSFHSVNAKVEVLLGKRPQRKPSEATAQNIIPVPLPPPGVTISQIVWADSVGADASRNEQREADTILGWAKEGPVMLRSAPVKVAHDE